MTPMPKYCVHRHEIVQPLDKPYRLIPLTQGQNVIVDAADFERLSQWNWYTYWSRKTKSFYAHRDDKLKQATVHMAADIIGCKNGEIADHENHDTLDNRRENLRKSTHEQNNYNTRIRCDTKTGFKGVHLVGNRWKAQIGVKHGIVYLGYFGSARDAAKAYNEAAKKLHGEFASLNGVSE